MADSAHVQTDKKIEEMERHLTSIYRRANKEVKATADKYFKKFEAQDKKKRELVESGELDEKTYQQWRMNKLAYGKRYEDMQNQIAAEMLNANKTATAYINGELPEVYALNYNSLAPDVEGLGGYSFTLTDAQTIKNLATEDETLLPYKEVDGRKDVRWNTRKVNSEVLQGILQGDSIPKIASRMQNVTSMNLVSAVRNARTSVTSAECKGRFDSYKQAEKDGIVLKKVWVSTEDGRTRHTHVMLDGQEVAPGKPFKSELGDIMYPGDPTADPANIYNCRCTTIAKVEGFKKARVEEVMEQREEKPTGILKKPLVHSKDKGYDLLLSELKSQGIDYLPVKMRKKALTQEQIIRVISGGDETTGSCVSLGLTYIGQKMGWDITDFRGGKSLDYFSSIENLDALLAVNGIKTLTAEGKTAITIGNRLLKQVETGKEYFLGIGKHAAIVRKTPEGKLQYLELQSATKSGWTSFDGNPRYTLSKRFGCSSTSDPFDSEFYLMIDIDESDFDTDEFKSILGYINTAKEKQKKGASGYVK